MEIKLELFLTVHRIVRPDGGKASDDSSTRVYGLQSCSFCVVFELSTLRAHAFDLHYTDSQR